MDWTCSWTARNTGPLSPLAIDIMGFLENAFFEDDLSTVEETPETIPLLPPHAPGADGHPRQRGRTRSRFVHLLWVYRHKYLLEIVALTMMYHDGEPVQLVHRRNLQTTTSSAPPCRETSTTMGYGQPKGPLKHRRRATVPRTTTPQGSSSSPVQGHPRVRCQGQPHHRVRPQGLQQGQGQPKGSKSIGKFLRKK